MSTRTFGAAFLAAAILIPASVLGAQQLILRPLDCRDRREVQIDAGRNLPGGSSEIAGMAYRGYAVLQCDAVSRDGFEIGYAELPFHPVASQPGALTVSAGRHTWHAGVLAERRIRGAPFNLRPAVGLGYYTEVSRQVSDYDQGTGQVYHNETSRQHNGLGASFGLSAAVPVHRMVTMSADARQHLSSAGTRTVILLGLRF